ncbi:MAG: FixH family protein [Proteobacteria bacterium]|nr:FixH family protein [Pseudomonadota bacterium]
MIPAAQAPQDNPENPPPEKTEEAEEKPAPKPAKPLPAWVPAAVMGLFLFLTVGVGYVIWLVVNTWHLVRDDFTHMSSGRVVEKQRYEDALGWGSELMVDKKPGKPARIRFLLHDSARHPITDAVVEILMTQSQTPGAKPVSAALKMDEPGVYRGEVEMEGSGLWEAQIRVTQGKNSYQVTQRVMVP